MRRKDRNFHSYDHFLSLLLEIDRLKDKDKIIKSYPTKNASLNTSVSVSKKLFRVYEFPITNLFMLFAIISFHIAFFINITSAPKILKSSSSIFVISFSSVSKHSFPSHFFFIFPRQFLRCFRCRVPYVPKYFFDFHPQND